MRQEKLSQSTSSIRKAKEGVVQVLHEELHVSLIVLIHSGCFHRGDSNLRRVYVSGIGVNYSTYSEAGSQSKILLKVKLMPWLQL